MDEHDTHRNDRSGMAALVGLLVAILVAAIATVPVEWFMASIIFAVLAMPAVLIVEPALRRLQQQWATTAPNC